MDAKTVVLERMANIVTTQGDILQEQISSSSLISIVTSITLFIVVTECWILSLKIWSIQGAKTNLTPKIWAYFLIVPMLSIATHLIGTDPWHAISGNPFPMVATLAISGYDSSEILTQSSSINIEVLENALKTSMSGRASQMLISSSLILVIAFFFFTVGKFLIKNNSYNKTGYAYVTLSFLLALMFLPIMFDKSLWSAFSGNYIPMLENIYNQNSLQISSPLKS